MERKGFCFYKSFWEMAKFLNQKQKLAWFEGIMNFVFEQQEPDFQDNALKVAWVSIRPTLHKSNMSALNGVKGGASKSLDKKQPSNNLEQPSDNLEEPNRNLEEPNDNLLKEKSKIISFDTYVNYNIFNKRNKNVNARASLYGEEQRKKYLEQFSDFISKAPPSYLDEILEIIDTIIEAQLQSTTVEGLCFNQRIYFEKLFNERISELDSDDFAEVFKSIHFGDPSRIEKRPIYILACLFKQIDKKIRENGGKND